MGISWRSVVTFFSPIATCCKRPTASAPHSPHPQPTHSQQSPSVEHSPDVPILPPIAEPSQLRQIVEPDQLDRFIEYIERLLAALQKKSTHQSVASTSSEGAEFSGDVKFAGDIMEKISSEAEKFQDSTGDLTSQLSEEGRRIVTSSLKGLGNLHWIALAFSMLAYVLENIHQVSSNMEECIGLLEKSVELARILQKLSKRMSRSEIDEKHKLEDAVHMIVKGAITCCSYMQGRTLSRHFTAQTVGESLKDAHAKLRELISDLSLLVGMDIQAQQPRRLEQPQNILNISEPVGMEEPFEEVKHLLNMESGGTAKAVIIYGFGGAGKTTLAEYVVSNLPLDGFKLSVVRIDNDNLDIKKLQEQILFDVAGQKIDLRNYQEGQNRLKDALKDRLCFLLIDNIVHKNQVRDLLPRELSLPSKSRILITSRNSDVREALPRTIQREEYHVDGISGGKSVELLQKTVLNDVEIEAFDGEKLMIEELAKACCRVPLLLTVFGGHLRNDRSKEAYGEALRWLQKGEGPRWEEEGLSETLMYVFHRMKNQDAKDAFLDICIYFHGWSKRTVSFIVGEDELKLLEEGALVKITGSNEVIVHDVLKSLGTKEGKATRIQCTADFLNALQEDEEVLKTIKGIWFDSDSRENRSEKFDFDSKHLNKMCKSLRVLNLGDGIVLGGQCQCQGRKFKNLRYLKFESVNSFPFKDVSMLEKLTTFHCMSKAACQLELDGLPQTLKELRLVGRKFNESFAVHPSWWRRIQNLTNLQVLGLSRLTSLNFPQDFVLPATLRKLSLIGCPDLEYLPREFGQLTSLTDLTLWFCQSLSILPADLGGLRSLKCFEIDECGLTELPEGFGQLTSLTDLTLESCQSLSVLPADFGGLRSLKCFKIVRCGLTELPERFGQLTSLTDLTLKSCQSLSILPADFGGLRSLKCLVISECGPTELPEGFGQLTFLTDLTMRECKRLSILPADFGGLRSLKCLYISGCGLTELPEGFGQLTSLTDLTLKFCQSLSILPADFGGLRSLKCLTISDCGLTELPEGFGQLTCLTDLTLSYCQSLSILPADFGGLRSLKCFKIDACGLTELPEGFGQLTCLTDLTLSYCPSLSILPADFGGLRSLKCFKIEGCGLTELPEGFGQLTSLTDLSMRFCYSFSILPADFGGLRSLECFNIRECGLITELPEGFGQLSSLKTLSLSFCKSLRRVPDDFGNLTSLTRLSMRGCPSLEAETMEKIVNLENLEEVDISQSSNLILKWEEMSNENNYGFEVYH